MDVPKVWGEITMRIQVIATVGILAMSFSADLPAQSVQTIPEAIAAGGGWVFPLAPSGRGPQMRDVLRRSDTLLRGTVGQPGPSYLSDDQRDVLTDYPIHSTVLLYQEALTPSDRPGVMSKITVTVRGGSITLNGVPFTAVYKGQPQLTVGKEYLLLLTKEGAKYRIVGDYYGVFGTVDGRFGPLYKPSTFAQEYVELGIDAAAERMVALLHSKSRTP